MTNGGDAAEQVVRLSLEGFEVAARLTGSAAKNVGMDFRAGKNGVPALYHGVRTSAAISKVGLFPNLQVVWMVRTGSNPVINGMTGIMNQKPETLFSLTGVAMVLLITLELLRSVKTEQFI